MPYSVVWNEALPTSASAANLIWDFIQDNLIAVRERVNDVFGTEAALLSIATADPYRIAKIKMTAAAASSIVPGITSFALRNNADTFNNILVLDNGNSDIRGTLKINKRAAGAVSALVSAAAVPVDLELANIFTLTLAHNVTFTFNNPVAGSFFTFQLTQDAVGSRTVTWPATVEWPSGTAPVITTTIGRTDVISMYYNGTKYIALVVGQNFDLS